MNVSNLIPSLLRFNYRRITPDKLEQVKRRASVAVVLRLSPFTDTSSSSSSSSQDKQHTHKITSSIDSKHPITFQCSCSARDNKHSESCLKSFVSSKIDNNINTTIEALYAKKSRGRRKGEIAFAGGHIELEETEEEAAQREALEEIGLDLSDGKLFAYIGRLNDRVTFDRIALYTFIYLQLTPETPKITFNDDEMEDCGWVDLNYFIKRKNIGNKSNNSNIVDSTIYNTDVVEFQSLASMSSRRMTNPFLKKVFNSFRVPLVYLPIQTSQFRLWGLTLELTSEILHIVNGYSPIPSIKDCNSRLAFFCINNPLLAISSFTLFVGLLIPGTIFYFYTL